MKSFYLGIVDSTENMKIRTLLKQYSDEYRCYINVRGIKEESFDKKIDICILDIHNYLLYQKELMNYPNIKIILLGDDKNIYYLNNVCIKLDLPIDEELFFNILTRLFNKIKQENIYVAIPNKGEEKLAIKTLNFIDIEKRNLGYHLNTDEIIIGKTIRTSFAIEVNEYLSHTELYFMKPSLLINIENIKKLYNDHMIFKSNEVLYYPKTAYKELRKRWKNCYSENE